MKKIIILLFSVVTVVSYTQNRSLIEIRNKKEWLDLKGHFLAVKYTNELSLKYKNQNYNLPRVFSLEEPGLDSIDQRLNTNYYYFLNRHIVLFILYNDVLPGQYVLYFNVKNHKAWCQKNEVSQDVRVYRVLSNYCLIEFCQVNPFNKNNEFRYLILNLKNGLNIDYSIDTYNNVKLSKLYVVK